MGKKIRQNITILLSRLGNYAFPNGKPTLDWCDGGGGDDPVLPIYSVQKTIGTGLSASGGDDDVNEGDRLEVTIAITNDLYIIDEDNVVVTMDGSPVDGAFDAVTGKITIAEVYGEVVINVPSMTYVQDNLVLHLDGKHRGGTGSAVSGHWKSLVDYNDSPIDFTLTSCDESHVDYVGFDGQSSKGIGSVPLLDVAAASGSIEAVYGGAALNSQACVIMHNALGSGSRICLASGHPSAYPTGDNHITMATAVNGGDTPLSVAYQIAQSAFLSNHYLSLVQESFLIGGSPQSPQDSHNQAANANSMLSLGYRKTSNDLFFKCNIYALRVYADKLTAEEQLQNYKVDKKRFNL